MFNLNHYFLSINVPAVSSLKINCAEKSRVSQKKEKYETQN